MDVEEKQSKLEDTKYVGVESKCENVRRITEVDGNESDGIGLEVKEEISHGEGLNTIELEKAQEESLDDKVDITGRALQSRSSPMKGSKEVEIADMEVDEGNACIIVSSKWKRNNALSGTKRVKVEKGESGRSGPKGVNKLNSPVKGPKVKEKKESLKGLMGKVRGRPSKETVQKIMAEEKQSKLEDTKCVGVESKCENVRRITEVDGNESDGIGLEVKEEISHGEGLNTFELEKAQEESSDDKVDITGRALQSRSSPMKGSKEVEIADMEVNEGNACIIVSSKRKRNNASSGTKRVKVEKGESGRSGPKGVSKLNSPVKGPKVKEKKESLKGLMGKVRGRPSKEIVQKIMADKKRNLRKQSKKQDKNRSLNIQSENQKRKRGRPRKVALEVTLESDEKRSTFSGNGSKSIASVRDEPSDGRIDTQVVIEKPVDSLSVSASRKDASTEAENNDSSHNKVQKKKRGRPRKVTLKATVEKEETLAFPANGEGSTSHVAVNNKPSHHMVDEKIITGKAIESQKVFSDGKDACHCSDNEKNDSNLNKTNKVKKKTKFMKRGGIAAGKKLLREQLKSFILDAGWTIKYLPRNGKEYNDAVYVSPKGRSFWSVTLAYRVLKNQYEENPDEVIMHAKPGFSFTSIPVEAVNMLQKMTKKRREREKQLNQQADHGSHLEPEVIFKKTTKKHSREKASSVGHRKKQNSVLKSGGKSSRGSSKRKRLELDEDLPNCMQELIGDRSRKSQNIKSKSRRALLARSTEKSLNSDADGFTPYNWKRTVLNWMVDMETIQLNGKLQCMKQRKTRTGANLEGTITRDGISCSCCDNIVSVSEFEAHANRKSCQLQNIYLEDGSSLLKCQLDSWNKQEESERKGFYHIDTNGEDPNDDSCGICGNGGDLICCDGCPSTFHQSCLGIKEFPSGDWHCIYCTCKFCGKDDRTSTQRDHDDMSSHVLLTCHLCEEKYHDTCVQVEDDLGDGCIVLKFCGKECREVFDKLQHLIGAKHELEEGYSWSLLQRCDVSPDLSLCGMSKKVECNSKLAVALSVMDECFVPIIDERTNISLIHNVVYNCGSNFNRLNYSGFLTATLEKGDEIIAAASVRIRGNHFAEMPFIGTRHTYRRQGMCSRLLNAIETALRSLNVKKLVIPAISELIQTWTKVFGFEPLKMSDRQEMKNMNLLVFPCTDMLQKPLSVSDQPKSQEIITPVADTGSTAAEEQTMPEGASATGVRSAAVDIDDSDKDITHEPTSELIPTGFEAQLPVISSNDKSVITMEAVDFPDSAIGTNELEDRNIIVGSSHEQNSQETVHDICRKQNVSFLPKLDEKNAEESSPLTILDKEGTPVDSLDFVEHAPDIVNLQLNKTDEVGVISAVANFPSSGTTDSVSVSYAAGVESYPDENNLEASNQHEVSETESLPVNVLHSLKDAAGVAPQSQECDENMGTSIVNLVPDSEAIDSVPDEANEKPGHQIAATSCSAVSPCSLTSSTTVQLFCPNGANKVISLSNQAN